MASEYPAHIAAFHSKPVPAQIPPLPAGFPPAPPQAMQASDTVTPTAPPPQRPRNPFINAQMLYANGGKIAATIIGVRSAAGVRSKTRTDIPDRGGFLLD